MSFLDSFSIFRPIPGWARFWEIECGLCLWRTTKQ